MDIDEFLKHSNRGGRNKRLKSWRTKEPYSITVWLHTKASILALWRHPWQSVHVREDRTTKQVTREVWGDRLVCYESEETLRNQFWRDKVTGEREKPPELCPHCKMIEHVRAMVHRGELSWVTPLFRWAGDDPTKTRTIHAGGLYNAFGAKDLTREQKAEMAMVKPENGGPIYAKNAWAQNSQSKLEYCFTVVDNDDLAAGIQVTVESNLLGDRVKGVIAKAIVATDARIGNPLDNPYPFRWIYNPADGIPFGEKYDAIRMELVKPSPAITKLIVETPPPDVGREAERFNLDTHRANLERHCLVKGLPWDDFFKAARADAAKPKQEDPNPGSGVVPEVGRPPPVAAVPQEELFACDACGKEMRASDTKCPHCGKVYEVEMAAPPAPPPLPKRSSAKGGGGPPPAAAAPPSVQGGGDPGYPDNPDDDIPFGIVASGECEAWALERKFPKW